MDKIQAFSRRIEVLHGRLGQLYETVSQSSTIPIEIFPSACKELGVAAEALQLANEELQRQNQQIVEMLEAASTQRNYYQSLLNYIPEAYIVTTMDGRIREANLATARLFRISESALVGKSLLQFIPPAQRASFQAEIARLAEINTSRTWSAWFQPRDTALVHLTLKTMVARSNLDNQVNLHWILREMTETWVTITPQPNDPPISNHVAAHVVGTANPELPTDSLSDEQKRPLLTYGKGEIIPLFPQVIWQVHQGLVKLQTLTEEGEGVLLGILTPSMFFGSGSPFLTVYQATAMTDVELVQFSLAEVKAFPHLAQQILPKMNQRIQQAEAMLMIAGQRRVRDRLCSLLRFLQQEIGESIPEGTRLSLRLTHEDLANTCCTTRVTITRLMGELQKQGAIAIDPKFHVILKQKF